MLNNIKFWLTVFALVAVVEVQSSTVDKKPLKEIEKDKDRSKRDSSFVIPGLYRQTAPTTPIVPPITQPVISQPPPQLGLPILGALISNVPGLNGLTSTLTTLVPLGNLGGLSNLGNLGNLGGLGSLGNLGGGLGNLGTGILGNLGNLGGLGNLANLGGLGSSGGGFSGVGNLGLGNLPIIGGLLPGSQQRCPVTQTLKCRCENIVNVPTLPATRSANGLEVLEQNMKFNLNGDKEISALLSNGILLYQRSGIDKLANNQMSEVIQGYYSLKIKDNKFLTIYYTLNDLDYTVKADVTAEPPQNDLDASTASVAAAVEA